METEEEFEAHEDQVKSNLKNSEIEFSKKSRNTLNKRGLVKLEEGKDSLREYQEYKNMGTLEYR